MSRPLAPGVHSVLVTPFRADETVDTASIGTLVDHYVAAGVDGVLVLGVLGEAGKLADAERALVLETAAAAVAGRVQLTVGISHGSTIVTAARAREAAALGAEAVMVSPPLGAVAGPGLRDFFLRVADGLGIGLVVQDLPEVTGVRMPVDFLASLLPELPSGSLLKLEEPPSAVKTAALLAALPGLMILGGLGGVGLLQELQAGAAGTMTGFALPELLVEICEAWRAGDAARARATYERALPLLVFEAQPVVGLGVRKEILHRRGAIAGALVRSPAPRLDGRILRELDVLLESIQEVRR